MTIRSISVIGAICGFVRYVSTTMIVRLRMNKPVIVVGSLQSHAVVVYVDRGGGVVRVSAQRISAYPKCLR